MHNCPSSYPQRASLSVITASTLKVVSRDFKDVAQKHLFIGKKKILLTIKYPEVSDHNYRRHNQQSLSHCIPIPIFGLRYNSGIKKSIVKCEK